MLSAKRLITMDWSVACGVKSVDSRPNRKMQNVYDKKEFRVLKMFLTYRMQMLWKMLVKNCISTHVPTDACTLSAIERRDVTLNVVLFEVVVVESIWVTRVDDGARWLLVVWRNAVEFNLTRLQHVPTTIIPTCRYVKRLKAQKSQRSPWTQGNRASFFLQLL